MDILTKIGTNNSVFQDAYQIRLKVFCEEQGIPQDHELDGLEDTAYHSVVYVNETPIGCGRMNISNDNAKISRIAVMKNFRKRGYALELCKNFISVAKQNGAKYVYLHAQTYIIDLYQKIGFVSEGEIFIEEGITHVRMTKKIYHS